MGLLEELEKRRKKSLLETILGKKPKHWCTTPEENKLPKKVIKEVTKKIRERRKEEKKKK